MQTLHGDRQDFAAFAAQMAKIEVDAVIDMITFDPDTETAPFDASLVPIAGDALLDRLADRLDEEDNPSRVATQLAALGAPRAVSLLLAMFDQHEPLRPQITSAMLNRPTS